MLARTSAMGPLAQKLKWTAKCARFDNLERSDVYRDEE